MNGAVRSGSRDANGRGGRSAPIDVALALLLALLVAVNLGAQVLFAGKHVTNALWFCDIAAVALAVGIVRRNAALVSAVLVAALPLQAVWIGDFLFNLIGIASPRTAWMFVGGTSMLVAVWTSLALHALLIPVSAYQTWKLGFSRASWRWLAAGFVFIYATTYIFTDPLANQNCAFAPCGTTLVESGGANIAYMLTAPLKTALLLAVSFGVLCTLQFLWRRTRLAILPS